MPVDETSLRILTELQSEGRLSMAELGRRVGLSAPAVTERVQRLERTGVITGYRAEVDAAALGLPLTAIIRVRPGPSQLRRIAEIAERTPEVVECLRITGEDCFLIKVHLRSIDQLEEVLDHFISFGQTTTSLVQSTPVPLRALPLS
jgi:Lrp/AsnC family leucine-responsive transcriptional regulator